MIELPHLEGNGIPMNRLDQLRLWVSVQLKGADVSLSPASADASFRRYFRVTYDRGTLIVMDAPPEQENCAPFVRVARLFRAAEVNVPEVLAHDLGQGFLLLTDFGSSTYLEALNPGNTRSLYEDALDALISIQCASRPGELPEYDRVLLKSEIELFPRWYVARHLGRELTQGQAEAFDAVCSVVLESNLREPRVFVHRDYHSRNLMLTQPNPGVLDFQDAVSGPISYDLVSLLKDAYIELPEEQVLDFAVRYWEKARAACLPVRSDFGDFYRDFEWMGVQRHLKVLGIFARLWHRDGKDGYLADLPLVLRYLQRAATRYRELSPLARLLDELHERMHSTGSRF
jgi:aminoglycoside/choline kinase family phosphotransferase